MTIVVSRRSALRHFSVAVLAIISAPALAVDVRPASEAEIAGALVGCWDQEPTREVLYFESIGISNHHTLCFHSGGKLEARWLGGDDVVGWEAGGDEGGFDVTAGRLVMSGLGDYLGRESVSCDVVMRSDLAVTRFENCVGSGPYPSGKAQDPSDIADMSFTRKADD